MAKRRTSVIQVMITGDASDLNKATRQGSDGMGLLGAAAITAAKVVTSALSGIAAFSIREFARFDQAMTQSQAIMGDLSDSTKKAMSDVAREIGVTTTFAAHEAADAFYFLASAGLSAEQSIAAMPRVAAFAQAGMFDLARATDILTDVQSSLAMDSADATENLANMAEISNVIVGVATLANASVEQFGEAFMRAGARIRLVGVPIEEAAAVLGAFARQGIKGAQGGEALSIILRDLPRAADKNAQAFRDLGIRIEEADGTFRPMADIVEDFEKALGGLSSTQQAAIFSQLGLTRSVADNIAQLLGLSDTIREYEADMKLMGDVTQEVADKQLQSFSNQIALTRAQFTNIALTIGEALAGPLRQFNLWLREQTPAIEAFVNDAIPKIAEFARNAVAKFREFKEAFQTNVIDPINAFLALPTTIAFFAEFEAEFERFTERLRNLGRDLRAAVDDEDPEAIGMVLGEFVAEVFRTAFGRAEVIGDAIKEAFGGQDWEDIGREVGAIAFVFFKGFVRGLFSRPKAVEDEFGAESRTIASRLADNFVGTMIGAFILSRVPLIGGIFRGMFSLMGAAFMRVVIGPFLALLGWKVPATLGLGMLKAIAGAMLVLLRGIVLVFAGLGHFVGKAIRVVFATLGGATTARAMMAGEAIRTFLRTKFVLLLRSGFGQAMLAFARTAIVAIGKAVGAIVVGFLGWPAILVAAAVAALALFIYRFGKWNEEQGDDYEGFGKRIVEFIGQGVEKLAKWFTDTVIQWFKDRWQDTKDLVGKIEWSAVGGDIIMGVVRGIKNKNFEIGNALLTAARDAWNRVKNFFKSKSPSMLFAGLGEDLMLGMAKGINESASVVSDAMRDVSVDTAAVRFDAPEVPILGRVNEQGQTVINVTVTSADPQAVVEAIKQYTRLNGPLSATVKV
jgi:TP901 family phage tail tape measure protein